MWFGLDWLVVRCRIRFKTSKIQFPDMKKNWVTTLVISWQNIIQKIEIEIELTISFKNIQDFFKTFWWHFLDNDSMWFKFVTKISRIQHQSLTFMSATKFSVMCLWNYTVKINVKRKKLSSRLKIKFPKIQKITVILPVIFIFPFHLKLLSIQENRLRKLPFTPKFNSHMTLTAREFKLEMLCKMITLTNQNRLLETIANEETHPKGVAHWRFVLGL